jgi:hypothetical protein
MRSLTAVARSLCNQRSLTHNHAPVHNTNLPLGLMEPICSIPRLKAFSARRYLFFHFFLDDDAVEARPGAVMYIVFRLRRASGGMGNTLS